MTVYIFIAAHISPVACPHLNSIGFATGTFCSNKGIKPYLLAFHFLSSPTHFSGRKQSRVGLPADSLSQSIEETITEGREGEIEKSVTLSVREIEKYAVTLSVSEIEKSPVTLSVREIEKSPVTLSAREIKKSAVTVSARDIEKSPVTVMSPEMKAIKSKSGIVALKVSVVSHCSAVNGK